MTRIFVGNLPTDIVEKDIENEFASYGTVNKVEIKHKKDPFSTNVMATFAFVTMTITDSLLNQCLQEFKNETFRGKYLKVTVARENFMEKLKREREESTQSSLNNSKAEVSISPSPSAVNIKKNAKIIQTFSSDDEESNASLNPFSKSSVETEAAIVKRKSKLFTENGKIKIPSFIENGSMPVTKVEQKTFDEKSERADRKRIESLINMKNTYNQQKRAVQQSLSKLESTQNKKIVFDEPNGGVSNFTNKSKALFDDEADDADDVDYKKDFEIKKQYEGEKGARLQKLQSRFQNDQRFKMNEKFLDDNDDGEESEIKEFEKDVDSKTDERKWQYEMLESVIGKKLQPEVKKKSDNPMLRYDPTKNDHGKYEKVMKRKASDYEIGSEQTKHLKPNNESDFQVSKEQFFNVTHQLTSALQPTSEGFSLLSMFGRDADIAESKPKNPYQEIILTKGQQNILTTSHSMFNEDSSDEEIIQERPVKSENKPANQSKQGNSKKNSKAEIWHEPFFIFGNDQRLQDGLALFLPNSSNELVPEEFQNKQKEMRNIIKRKIKKSIKRVIPRGGKPNKRFGRLVKDMS